MRASTVLSFAISVALAGTAVVGVRNYLADQRAEFAQRASMVTAQAPQNTIVVAARPLRFGNPVRAEDLQLIDWPSKNLPTGAFRTIEEAVGSAEEPRFVVAAIEKDEPVLATRVTGAGQRATLSAALTEGMKAVSIRVNDVLGVAGFVRPGDRVDVMLTRVTRGKDDSENTFVDVLLQGVKVLAVDQTADERVDQPSVVKTVTFEVSTAEAQQLTLAANVGTLSLALRNVASADIEQTQPMTLADLGGGPAAEALRQQREEAEASRLTELEKLVRNVGDTLTDRIGSVEDKLNKPVVVEKEIFIERPDPVETATPKPNFAVIGVNRGREREEYRVKLN